MFYHSPEGRVSSYRQCLSTTILPALEAHFNSKAEPVKLGRHDRNTIPVYNVPEQRKVCTILTLPAHLTSIFPLAFIASIHLRETREGKYCTKHSFIKSDNKFQAFFKSQSYPNNSKSITQTIQVDVLTLRQLFDPFSNSFLFIPYSEWSGTG